MARARVDAETEFDGAPEYAQQLIAILQKKGLTRKEIASRVGLTKRQVININNSGFKTYTTQYAFEALVRNRI